MLKYLEEVDIDDKRSELSAEEYDPHTKPGNPLEAIKRAERKAGVTTGHITGHFGVDPEKLEPVVDDSSQPIQAARDRFQAKKDDD